VIPTTLDNVTQGELQRYENNNNAVNLITTAIPMRALVKLNLLIRTLTIGNIKHFLRNLESRLMITLLGLSQL
jgi:hypothetical protein